MKYNLNIFSVGRFTEDGSFIGQYVPSNMKHLGSTPTTRTNATATYV